MKNIKIAFTFDDGLLDQFKWARLLHSCGIRGTFYINPFNIGNPGFLTLWQLRMMNDEWGHTIANHFWIHECPRNASMKIMVGNLLCAKEWLKNNDFDGGELVALPYGSVGGRWTKEHIEELFKHCLQIRDFNYNPPLNDINEGRFLVASERFDLVVEEGKTMIYCFHKGGRGFDEKMLALMDLVKEFELVSMKDLFNVSNIKPDAVVG